MGGSVTIIGVIAGYFITKSEYTFQKRYDRKIVLITDLYKQVVQLDFELKRYLHLMGAELKQETINRKIEALNKIKADFQKFQHKFWETEIILDEDINKKIRSFLDKYIEITAKLTVANINQQLGDTGKSFDEWNDCLKLASNDLLSIKEILKREFRKNLNK